MKRTFYSLGGVALLSVALLIVAYMTLALSGVQGPGFESAPMRKEEEDLRAEIVDAKRCIADLRKRDPYADAADDISRGDITPIGLTNIPHDPPSPTTTYPNACERIYEGPHRSTGKWLKPHVKEFTFRKRSSDFVQCAKVKHDYVVSYNRYMVERQPDKIKLFCTEQRLDTSGRTGEAARTVLFPNKKPQWISGGIAEKIGGVSYVTKPAWLIDGSFQSDDPSNSVLVMTSVRKNRVADCGLGEFCADIISLAYLTPAGQEFRMDRRWNELVQVNAPGWKYSGLSYGGAKVSRFPEVRVRETFKADGCQSGRETIIELTPAEPINRGTIYTDLGGYDTNGFNQRLSGQIENVIADRSFDIVVPLTDVRESYKLIGRRFIGPPTSQLGCGVRNKHAGSNPAFHPWV